VETHLLVGKKEGILGEFKILIITVIVFGIVYWFVREELKDIVKQAIRELENEEE